MSDENGNITRDELDRLNDIEFEICELADEAMDIIRGTSEEGRSKAYWFGEVYSAMNNEKYVESTCSLQSVIESLEDSVVESDEDDEDYDDDNDDNRSDDE